MMDPTNLSLRSINQSGFLLPEDLNFLAACRSELRETWTKQQVFRTETEMRVGVLDDGKFPTQASKYWQCVREQAVFFDQLVLLSFYYRRNQVEMEKIDRQLEGQLELDDLSRTLLEIDREEKAYAQANMERIARDRVRELRAWSHLMAELDDGSFDTGNPDTDQLESLIERFKFESANIQFATLPEANNVMGQLRTALRLQDNAA